MKLHEYQAKAIFARYGIPVPEGEVATTPQEAYQIAKKLNGPSVVKAQVHAGGRGKAGGIVAVASADEAFQAASSLLGQRLVTSQTGVDGAPVHKVLVERPVSIVKELYLGLTVDRNYRGPVVMASEAGGMDIEEVAAINPEKILREAVNPAIGLQSFQGRSLAVAMGLGRELSRPGSLVIAALSRLFTEYDCSLVEINPLVVTQEGGLLALDAKISVDDDALFRHPELQDLRDPEQEDPYETKAAQAGISYVKLGGDVGCLVNGAGLAMATMDVINKAGFEPANFLDVGGGAAEEKVAEACRIMLSDPNVNRVLVNIFGGILRCDIAARGIVMAFTQAKSELPVSVRMRGTNVEEGLAILKNSRLNVTFADSLAEVGSTLRGS
jgi:succinyl-CoA synthetase beta subunit